MVDIPRFRTAIEEGEVIDKSGHHKPNSYPRNAQGCGCTKTTRKGAYRDVSVQYEDLTIHYLHQSPVVVELPDGGVRVSDCGWRTRTTKARINHHIPSGYFVQQIDGEWFVDQEDGERVEYESGMVLYPPKSFSITVTGPS